MTRVVRPLQEIAERCGEDPACRDGPPVLGKFNVPNSVCARIYASGQRELHQNEGNAAGGCAAYSSVTSALVEAAPVIIEPQYSVPPERFCAARVWADAGMSACARKLQEYDRMCESTTFRIFCRRQHQYLSLQGHDTLNASFRASRIFERCSEPSVGEYMQKVEEVNTACAAEPSFQPLSDLGGANWWEELDPSSYNSSEFEFEWSRWQDKCIITSVYGLQQAGVSLSLYITIFAVIVGARCIKVELPWMTAADFTTDICRSRWFTAVSITWLLYAFYILSIEYFLHPDSAAYIYIQAKGVPRSLYFLLLSLAWLPHFVLLLQGNNPYRSRAISFTITGAGLVVQHFVAFNMFALMLRRFANDPGSVTLSLFGLEMGISGLLCLTLDLSFLHMICKTDYVIRFRDSCLAHTRKVLNQLPSKPSKDCNRPPPVDGLSESPPDNTGRAVQNVPSDMGCEAQRTEEGGGGGEGREEVTEEERLNRQIGIRIVVHVGCAKVAVPTHDELAYYFSHHLFGGMFPPRRLVVTSLKIVKPSGACSNPSGDAKTRVRYHSDLAAPQAHGKDESSVLTMWPLDGPRWFKQKLKRRLAPGTTMVEVSMLVCGACRTLQERHWLCDMLERECAIMGQRKDDAGFVHVNGRLTYYRKMLHSVDQPLIRLMIDRLNSSLLIQALSTTAEQLERQESPTPLLLAEQTERQGAPILLTLDQLQMLMGPTFQALKESILTARLAPGLKWENVGDATPLTGNKLEIFNERLAGALAKGQQEFTREELDAFQVSDLCYNSCIKVGNVYFRPATRAVADRNKIENFLEVCTRSGVLFEHAEILSCLPADELQRVQSRIEKLQKHGEQDWTSLHKVQLLVAAEVSKEFMEARNLLVQQLQAPAFEEWLRENSKILSNPGWPSRTEACTDVEPGFPLAATFAFFQQTVAAESRASPMELSAEDIIQQLIGLGNFHNSPDALKDEALGRTGKEKEEVKPNDEHGSKDKRLLLKMFRALVYKAVTLQNNPSIIAEFVMPRPKAVNTPVDSHAQELVVLSVQEWKPRAVAEARLSTRFVVMQPPDHEANIADAKKHAQDDYFLPTILWVSIMLALLVILRTFAINMFSHSQIVTWMLDVAAWLNSSCDRVEVAARTSVAFFQ